MELRVNTTLQNGKYTILQIIGSGGFGITYLAMDNRLERQVVVKEYFPKFMVRRDTESMTQVMTLGPDYSEDYNKGLFRFLSEAKTLALLGSIPEIATVHDFFQENGTAYIVMEYIKGKNLKQIIRERIQPFTFDEALTLIRPCLESLGRVHDAGLIHRDFTPDNIIIDEKGRPRIIDFGSSRDYATSEATMTIMVKHGYAPIEQYSNGVKQGTYTDVYSISAILYEMLTLNKPAASIERMRNDPVLVPSALNHAISQAEDAVVMRGLAVEHEDRFQTIAEFLKACETKIVPAADTRRQALNINNSINNTSAVTSQMAGNATEIVRASEITSGTATIPQGISTGGQATEVVRNVPGNTYGQAGYYGNTQAQGNTQTGQYGNAAGQYGNQVPKGYGNVQPSAPKDDNRLKKIIIAAVAAIAAIIIIVAVAVGLGGDDKKSSKSNGSRKTSSKEIETSDDEVYETAPAAEAVAEPAYEEEAHEEPEETEPEILREEPIKVGFVQVGHESDWRVAMTNNFNNVFTPANGYELTLIDANNDNRVQIEAVRNLIEGGADYICLSPIETAGWDTVLMEAQDAGIPVLIVDRSVDSADSLYTTTIGCDMVKEGETAGVVLADILNGAPANILVIAGAPGASATIGRSEGFNNVAYSHREWTILDEQSGDFTMSGGYEVMRRYIQAYRDFNVVVCHNDNEAYGAMEAMDEAGISYGVGGDVIVVSYDATYDAMQYMLNGKININVECNPLQAVYADEVIRKLEAGRSVDKYTLVEDKAFVAPGMRSSHAVTMTQEVLNSRTY